MGILSLLERSKEQIEIDFFFPSTIYWASLSLPVDLQERHEPRNFMNVSNAPFFH